MLTTHGNLKEARSSAETPDDVQWLAGEREECPFPGEQESDSELIRQRWETKARRKETKKTLKRMREEDEDRRAMLNGMVARPAVRTDKVKWPLKKQRDEGEERGGRSTITASSGRNSEVLADSARTSLSGGVDGS